MYVYIYIYIYIHIYVYIYIYIYSTALRATSATALDESIPTWLQNPPRWNPKSMNLDPQMVKKTIKNRSKIKKNLSKIDQKSILGVLGGDLGPS